MSPSPRFARGGVLRVLLAMLLAVAALAGAEPLPEYGAFASGWGAYQDGRLADAGRLWERTSTDLEKQAGASRQAAFAAVLAAFALDRANDVRAQELWARAGTLYARSGDTWPRHRAALGAELTSARSAGASIGAPGAPAAVPPFLRMVAALDNRDRLLSYDGPHAAAQAPQPPRAPVGIGVGYLGSGGLSEPGMQPGSVYSSLAVPTAPAGSAPRPPRDANTNTNAAPASAAPASGSGGEGALYRAAVHADAPDGAPSRSTCDSGPLAPLVGAWRPAAVSAWSYFRANRQVATGLVDGKRGYPYITTADLAGTLAALVAADQLGLDTASRIEPWLRQALETVRDLPRYGGELPARQYDARTGTLVGLDNGASPTGSGYSLHEVARVLVWLEIIASCYPDLRADALAARADWRFDRATSLGRLHSVLARDGNEQAYVDEPLGGKEYTAAGLSLAGLSIPDAFSYSEARATQTEDGVVWYDVQPASLPTSDPFILGAIELGGIDGCFVRIGRASYDAQAKRAARLGRAVAVGAEPIDRPPWFSFSTVRAGDIAWKAASYDAREDASLRMFSAKTAFGWAALHTDRYAATLLTSGSRFVRDGGVTVGQYESGVAVDVTSLATNAQVLEAAWYAARGKRPFLVPTVPGPPDCPAPSNPVIDTIQRDASGRAQ
ncbi:hypothetical protein WL32_16910 [Burkholderia cepacia]|uniref:DUF3131 domain-containing protein n=1 Tax=Burkholderia cepacia TaxID=292 RepID=UPI00076D4585|nr:DUF3131 domain-containing protein [Burkholderia cepacia]KWB20811.1 hypothetical protein WL32_16910 [Burkholderia cepacia]